MNREQSRRECCAVVAALDLPDPFELAEFCTRLGRQIGRDIVLMSHSMVIGGLCGTWMRTAKADYVFYEEDTSQLHQQHIIFHEVGHILRSHVPGKELSKDVARTIAAGMKVSDVFRVLGRDSYTDDDEFEAELIATLILSRIGRQTVLEEPQATDPTADDIVARITNSLSRGER
jgi:hypothetical protein